MLLGLLFLFLFFSSSFHQHQLVPDSCLRSYRFSFVLEYIILCAIQREPKLGVAEFGKYDQAGKGIGVGRADERKGPNSHLPSLLPLTLQTPAVCSTYLCFSEKTQVSIQAQHTSCLASLFLGYIDALLKGCSGIVLCRSHSPCVQRAPRFPALPTGTGSLLLLLCPLLTLLLGQQRLRNPKGNSQSVWVTSSLRTVDHIKCTCHPVSNQMPLPDSLSNKEQDFRDRLDKQDEQTSKTCGPRQSDIVAKRFKSCGWTLLSSRSFVLLHSSRHPSHFYITHKCTQNNVCVFSSSPHSEK